MAARLRLVTVLSSLLDVPAYRSEMLPLLVFGVGHHVQMGAGGTPRRMAGGVDLGPAGLALVAQHQARGLRPASRTASARAVRSSSSARSEGRSYRTSSQPSGAVMDCAWRSHRSQLWGSLAAASGPTTAVDSEYA
ncbi:hypothetical protein WU86_00075 [Corynebacterium xerosis]|nr:hypothetical protein WU86_00075 [Corynebacterium xerosis]